MFHTDEYTDRSGAWVHDLKRSLKIIRRKSYTLFREWRHIDQLIEPFYQDFVIDRPNFFRAHERPLMRGQMDNRHFECLDFMGMCLAMCRIVQVGLDSDVVDMEEVNNFLYRRLKWIRRERLHFLDYERFWGFDPMPSGF